MTSLGSYGAFPTERRDREALRAIHVPGMAVATAVLKLAMRDPLASVWLPVGQPIRLSLPDLSQTSLDAHQRLHLEDGYPEPARASGDTSAEGRSVSVTDSVYDPPPEGTPPPCGVAGIRVERMDLPGAELLAQDLLDLLEWVRTEKDRGDD